jgi:hypothetical protein
MKLVLALISISAGSVLYPSWHEDTASVCGAMDKRATIESNAILQGSNFFSASLPSISGAIRNSAGEILGQDVAAQVSCTVGYWRMLLDPDIGQVFASIR